MSRTAGGGMLIVFLAAAAVDAQVPAGPEFRVDDGNGSWLQPPNVAMDGSGGFLVSWRREVPLPHYIRARRYDPLGDPVGSEFTLSDTGDAAAPHAAADRNNSTMVVWSAGGGYGAVRARRFDASGQPIGPSTNVNGPFWASSPGGVAAGRAEFLVVWNPFYVDAGVRARVVDSAGNPQGAPFLVSSSAYASRSAVAGASRAGSFVVVYRASGADGYDIFGQRLDAAGQKLGTEFIVNAYTTGYQLSPRVASDEDGNFVVVWHEHSSSRLVARRFDAAGSPLGEEFDVVPAVSTFPVFSAAADRAGNLVVVWESQGASGRDISARRFTATGVPRGGVFRVNTETLDDQVSPSVTADGAGNLMVAWIGQDRILGQRFGGLVPAALSVLDGPNRNGVLEVGDTFTALTSWRNVTGGTATFQGGATEIAAPAGLVMTLSPVASYVDVANGDVASCSGRCFAGTLTGKRPAGHADATFLETIVPDVQGQTRRWRLHVGESFKDVPRTNPFYCFIETLLHHDVTTGCGGGRYCPGSSTTREQMAAFLLVSKDGAGLAPPSCFLPPFGDVPVSSPFCPWIQELVRRGVASGCGDWNYCPSDAVTREQMAVFVLRTLDPNLNPPACTTPMFNDVPASSPFCRWIEELARRGIVNGCGSGNYCPTAPVTREQMAVFLTGTFALTLYGP